MAAEYSSVRIQKDTLERLQRIARALAAPAAQRGRAGAMPRFDGVPTLQSVIAELCLRFERDRDRNARHSKRRTAEKEDVALTAAILEDDRTALEAFENEGGSLPQFP